jgi:hypothetical protein
MRNTHPLLMLYEALCANEELGAAEATGHPNYGEEPQYREGVPKKACSAAAARVLLFPLADTDGFAAHPDYAVVVCTSEDACVYLAEPRLSYWVQFASMTADQQDAWRRDLREHRLVPLRKRSSDTVRARPTATRADAAPRRWTRPAGKDSGPARRRTDPAGEPGPLRGAETSRLERAATGGARVARVQRFVPTFE